MENKKDTMQTNTNNDSSIKQENSLEEEGLEKVSGGRPLGGNLGGAIYGENNNNEAGIGGGVQKDKMAI